MYPPEKELIEQLGPILGELPLNYVTPFDDARIASFALNWYRQREESERRAKERASNLTEAVRRDAGTTTLARIPNLLTLMALIHRLEADLPHGKARLYAKIVETYLETIDNYRKLTERPDSLLDKKRWLARVGFEMQKQRSPKVEPEFTTGSAKKEAPKEEEKREILIGRDDLHKLIRIGMEKSGKKTEDADIASFIDHIQRRSGLLIERGAGQFAFTHLSFQEYFAAWHMSRLVHGTSEFEECKRFVDDAAWLETFCFFFEIVADEQQERKEDIRRGLLGTAWESGEPLPEYEENKAILLARLACDRYSGLDDLAAQAVTSSIRWDVASQNRDFLGSQIRPIVLQILLAAPDHAEQVLEEFVQVAAEGEFRWISLSDTSMTDLKPLSGLTNLEKLDLRGTRVTDLKPLAGLTNLQWLFLHGTSVTDLKPLAGLTKLQVLDLQATSVTDLKPLAGLTSLWQLFLKGTSVTQAEVDTLKAALPVLRIAGP